MNAVQIVWNGSFLPELALLLLDLGKQEEPSLEKDCQKYLATHEEVPFNSSPNTSRRTWTLLNYNSCTTLVHGLATASSSLETIPKKLLSH